MRDGEEIADRERHERARRKILLRSWSAISSPSRIVFPPCVPH